MGHLLPPSLDTKREPGRCLSYVGTEGGVTKSHSRPHVSNDNPFSESHFASRLETLLTAITDQPGARLPGLRRFELRAEAEQSGVQIPNALLEELRGLTG